MESVVFWFIVLFAGITIYRLLSRRMATPKAKVTAMLRRASQPSGGQETGARATQTKRLGRWHGVPRACPARAVAGGRSRPGAGGRAARAESPGGVCGDGAPPRKKKGKTTSLSPHPVQ